MIELCACGHANDHVGKPCKHPAGEGVCSCPAGVRVDVATVRLLDEIGRIVAQHNALAARTLAVVEAATGLESRMVSEDGGRTSRAEVRQKQGPRIIVPG